MARLATTRPTRSPARSTSCSAKWNPSAAASPSSSVNSKRRAPPLSTAAKPESPAMRLSTKGRYAVMAMVDLAGHSEGQPVVLADIAERQTISLSYLEQLFAKLRAAGLVKSVRGPGGGYLLGHGADETRISEIILAVDEPIRATRCSPGAPVGCRGNQTRCLTHDLWEELGNQINLFLSSVTLADVVERRVLGSSRLMPSEPARAEPATSAIAAQ